MARMKILYIVGIAGVLIGILFYAPHYLTYSDKPRSSDAVVLLVGPDFEARKKEANHLIGDGYADFLIIPAYGRISKATKDGTLKSVKKNRANRKNPARNERAAKSAQKIYENTHLEMLYAKAMIDEHGLKSAIFVSSPYHMRRIKIIAGRIFDQKDYELSFVPTRYEKPCNNPWWTNKYGFRRVMGEYIKIGWFLLYEPFVGN